MTQPKGRPLSAEAAAVVKAMSGGRLSRRSLMAGAGAAGAGAFLASCGTSGAGDTTVAEGKPSPAADRSKEDKSVNWTNWTLYLDYDEETKTYPSLEAFQTATGIKTTYSEDIEDNASYYAKIQPQISRGQDFGADIVVFTDWMMSRMIREGYAQKFDKSVMPNVTANLLPTFADVDYDPGRNYSVTWQSGYGGIAWNKKALEDLGVPPLKRVSDLWNPKLKGRVEVLSEMRDTMGLIMMDQGADITKFTAAQFDKALSELETQLSSGQIRQVRGNSYAEELTSGDALAVIGWSGDIIQLQMDPKNEGKFEFAIPEGGGHLWADNLFIPITSPHKENAEILINYYYDPKVAAEVAEYVNYICPVKGAEKYVDPELADNYMIFPKGDENVHVFRTLTAEEQTAFSEKFQAVLGV
jgi:spermidine/putrescine transport system substrate-binding protein